MKSPLTNLTSRFARSLILIAVATGLSAGAADAAQVVTIPLAGETFGHGDGAEGQSTGLLNASTAYFYKITGTCKGTGPILTSAIPPGTKIADLLNDIEPGAAAKLTGTKLHPAGTLPISVLDKTVSGEKDGASFTMTFSIIISGTGKVSFNIKDVTITTMFGPMPGGVELEDSAKAVVGVAPVIKMATLAQNVRENAGEVSVVVKRTGNLGVAATVKYETLTGTATDAHFKHPTSGTLTFDAGQTSRKVTVIIKNNELKDGARKFSVKLSKPGTAVLGNAVKTVVTINSDE